MATIFLQPCADDGTTAPIMPSCHRRSSAGSIIHYSYSPCKQVAILLSVILLLLPAIVDSRQHGQHASISIRQQRRPIWRRRILGGGIPSFILRVPRGGGPVISAVTEEISIDTHSNETTNMMENNDVTLRRTLTTSIATATAQPLHNDTTYVRMEENGEEDSIIAAAAVATNDGDVVLDDIDTAVTPTTIVSSSKTVAAATEIQYVTKKDGTMELFNKEKVR